MMNSYEVRAKTLLDIETLTRYNFTNTSPPFNIYLICDGYDFNEVLSLITFIKKNSLNIQKITVSYNYRNFSDIKNTTTLKDLKVLRYLNLFLRHHYNIPLIIEENFCDYLFEQAYEAELKVFNLANKILQITSHPLEQLLLAHDYVSTKLYFKKDSYDKHCTNFIGAMTTKSIVCMGYAKIMEKVCSYLGIDCLRYESVNSNYYMNGIHSFNVVNLVDPHYNIDGYFLLDATWNSTLSRIGERSYLYFLYPLQDCRKKCSSYSRYFCHYAERLTTNGEYISERLPADFSPVIDYSTIKEALNNVYKNKTHVEKALEYTINLAKERDPCGENCFSTFPLTCENTR